MSNLEKQIKGKLTRSLTLQLILHTLRSWGWELLVTQRFPSRVGNGCIDAGDTLATFLPKLDHVGSIAQISVQSQYRESRPRAWSKINSLVHDVTKMSRCGQVKGPRPLGQLSAGTGHGHIDPDCRHPPTEPSMICSAFQIVQCLGAIFFFFFCNMLQNKFLYISLKKELASKWLNMCKRKEKVNMCTFIHWL